MATISFNIPDNKIQSIVQAMCYLYPKEVEYTNNQWAKECIRRWVIKQVAIHNYNLCIVPLDTINSYNEDNDLLT